MYRGFKLDNIKNNEALLSRLGLNYIEERRFYNEYRQECFYRYLYDSVNNDSVISGSMVEDKYFPIKNTDVFLSHSHRDKDLAIKIANWLRATFDLNVFIDSYVWGHADGLIKEIVDIYGKKTVKSRILIN
jgi:hypothetical protein